MDSFDELEEEISRERSVRIPLPPMTRLAIQKINAVCKVQIINARIAFERKRFNIVHDASAKIKEIRGY